jgi:hypothetical protein
MPDNSPYDYVWLGLLIGHYDDCISTDGLRQLLDWLDDLGLPDTKTKITNERLLDTSIESIDIARWLDEELRMRRSSQSTHPPIGIHDATNLISSMRQGVYSQMPPGARDGFVQAEKCILDGQFNAAALLLGRCVEAMMKQFYGRVIPSPVTNATWQQMEAALYELRDRELFPALSSSKDIRLNHRNPSIHDDKTYDEYEINEYWHMSVQTVSRMARVLEKRSPLPDGGK